MSKLKEDFKKFVSSYEQDDCFNLLSACRAKYGDVALEDFLKSVEDFLSSKLDEIEKESFKKGYQLGVIGSETGDLKAEDAIEEIKKEERTKIEEEVKKVVVSWDIGSGDDWVVQFWYKNDEGQAELITQLDKNSDEGGNFELLTPPSKLSEKNL